MDETQQREFLRSAVERGLTIKQALDELETDDKHVVWRIRRDTDHLQKFADRVRQIPVPQSACPVVQQVLNHTAQISAFSPYPRADPYQCFAGLDLSVESTVEEQEHRAWILEEWFIDCILHWVTRDRCRPGIKEYEAWADMLRAETPHQRALATMSAAVTVMASVAQVLAEKQIPHTESVLLTHAGSRGIENLSFALSLPKVGT